MGLAYIKAIVEREKKRLSANDQSATSGNTFIAKRRHAEEMVEQPLAGLESKKTKRP